MGYPIKFICGKVARRDGTNLIYIQYCYSRDNRLLLNTGISVPRKNWNAKTSFVEGSLDTKLGNPDDLNDQLRAMMHSLEHIIAFATRKKLPNIGQFVKDTFTPSFETTFLQNIEADIKKKDPKVNLDLYFQIDDYIKSKTKKVCKDMPRIYRNMKDHLLAFETFREEKITFESLDFTFYEEFVDFLAYEYVQRRRTAHIVGLKTNTIGKTIKQFRTFIRNRIRKRIISPIDMDGWTILEEEVDAVYLSWAEIKQVYEIDLARYPHLEDYRNDMVLGCLTGLRFSDFSKLDEYDLRNGMLHKKQQKSEHWVVIPLRAEALEILNNRFKKGVPVPTNAEFNRHIKTVAHLAGLDQIIKHSYKKGNKEVVEKRPKYTWVTSHTCRRSFCTNEFLAGTPVELIMKISGHKSVKDFYKYIRISPEEAGRKMQELWQQRGDMNILQKAQS